MEKRALQIRLLGLDSFNYPTFREQLLDLYLNAFTTGEYAQHISRESAESTLDEIFRNGWGSMAFAGDEPAGALIALPLSCDGEFPRDKCPQVPVETSVYVAEVMTHSGFRGEGVASKLLENFLQRATSNYSNVVIRVWDENKPALSLYEKFGFQPVATIIQTKYRSRNEKFEMKKIYMMKELLAKTIDLRSGMPDEKRKEIRDYFLKTWAADELLYTQLKSDDAFYHRGDPLRHIILFYLGHTAVFFINKLFLGKIIDKRINPKFESVFAIGVDEMSWDDLDNNHYDWPPVSEVRHYRDKAKEAILRVIDTAPLSLPIDWESPFWIIMMGIEHERIHLETSSVLIRQLPLDEVVPDLFGKRCPETGNAPQNELVGVEGATMKLGKPMEHPFYGWDNEYGNYTEEVSGFKAAKYLTSNREFLEFMKDGGYETEKYWTEEGWNWRNFKQAEMPLFWRKDENGYRLRLVAEEVPMPWNWPVEVNYLEAKAFCNWKSEKTGQMYRLPTEAEWYRLHEVSGLKDIMEWESAPGNINLAYFTSPCPVDKFPQGDFYDVLGNVWQWTETPITGFPGFKVHPLYDDFSTPTFDGKHNLIKGGSWISTGNEATLHARYAFRRHFYQHAGFRYVQSDAPLNIQSADYETDEEVTLSCENNWGDVHSREINFSKRLAEIVLNVTEGKPESRVLDLNADTGRLAFELARHFTDVTALDFTARMIRIPIQLQEQGYMRYTMKDEGELVHFREVVLSDFGLEKQKGNLLFMQADAMNLKPNYSGYDMVIMPGLLEELSDPGLFLSHIHERMNDGGYLIIASSYNWDLSKTRRDKWLGGFKQDGEPVTSLDGLKAVLGNHFEMAREPFDMELTVRKTSRITENKVLEITVWRKRL